MEVSLYTLYSYNDIRILCVRKKRDNCGSARWTPPQILTHLYHYDIVINRV